MPPAGQDGREPANVTVGNDLVGRTFRIWSQIAVVLGLDAIKVVVLVRVDSGLYVLPVTPCER
jgi:hypothetical protein